MAPLAACANLASLTLDACPCVTDESLVVLPRACPGLRALSLARCGGLSSPGATLAAMPSLTTLRLDFTGVAPGTLGRLPHTLLSLSLCGARCVCASRLGVLGAVRVVCCSASRADARLSSWVNWVRTRAQGMGP